MRVITLVGTDHPATEESYAQVLYLLEKYSSWTYVNRMYQHLATFVREYHHFASRGGLLGTPQFYRHTLIRLYGFQAHLERGLGLLGRGDRSGYREIGLGCGIEEYMWGRGFDHGDHFEEVGFRRPDGVGIERSVGLFRWALRARDMAWNISCTVRAQWAFERVFVPAHHRPTVLPERMPVLARPRMVPIIPRGGEVPLTGIWQPIDVVKGCPNYLVAGWKDVHTQVPYERIYSPLSPEDRDPPKRQEVHYEFAPVATRWQLLWEDTRYRDGVIPDEPEYLDHTTHFPDDGIEPAPAFDDAHRSS